MRSTNAGKLWECANCGAKLVSKNLSHACGAFSVEAFLRGKSPIGRDLFDRFAKLIARCGPCDVSPAKTRVAFMAQVRFASVNRIGRDYIDVHFVLPQRITNPRIRRVEHLGKLYVHHLRLHDGREFDSELGGWLCHSYEEYGQRRWLMTTREAGATQEEQTSRPSSPRRLRS